MSQQLPDARPRRSWRELALNVGAVAGVICIAIAVASMLFGIKPLVFRSGSMSPEITTGSLAIARTVPATEIRVGDVVSVENVAGTRISHRVIAVTPVAADRVSLTLKGDANSVADPLPYEVTHVDRVITSVPYLGYVAAWLSSKTAIFLGGIVAGGLLMLAFGPLRRPGAPTSEVTASDHAPETETLDVPAADGEAKLQEASRG